MQAVCLVFLNLGFPTYVVGYDAGLILSKTEYRSQRPSLDLKLPWVHLFPVFSDSHLIK